MAHKAIMIATALAVALPGATAQTAFAKDRDERVYQGRDRDYRDRDYRERCKRSDHATGTIAGAAGGALAGNVIGGGTLGTIAGGVGGALLGRHIDKKEHNKRNRERGC